MFKEIAEKERSRLRQRGAYGSSSDLFVNEKAKVAVIGIQTSGGGSGHDTIYVLRERGGKVTLETVLDRTFHSGRMWPTGISKDGRKFFYTVKDEQGKFHDYEYQI